MGWTEERVARLRKLWAEGLSASQIAKALTGVTRNAVIGKVSRLGLSGRASPSRPARIVHKRARPAPPRRTRTSPVTPVKTQDQVAAALEKSHQQFVAALARSVTLRPVAIDGAVFATVENIKSGQCRFPIGDPCDSSFAFCGRPVAGEAWVYCTDHAVLCYQPAAIQRAMKSEDKKRALKCVAAG